MCSSDLGGREIREKERAERKKKSCIKQIVKYINKQSQSEKAIGGEKDRREREERERRERGEREAIHRGRGEEREGRDTEIRRDTVKGRRDRERGRET